MSKTETGKKEWILYELAWQWDQVVKPFKNVEWVREGSDAKRLVIKKD